MITDGDGLISRENRVLTPQWLGMSLVSVKVSRGEPQTALRVALLAL